MKKQWSNQIVRNVINLTRISFIFIDKKDFEDGTLAPVQDDTQLAKIHALLLQATVGDFDRVSFARHSCRLEWTQEFAHAVALQYSELTGLKSSSAQYRCLKEFSLLEEFGYEYHRVRTEDGSISQVGVGGEGLRFCDEISTVQNRYVNSHTKTLRSSFSRNSGFKIILCSCDVCTI